jgi:hypothetical protein
MSTASDPLLDIQREAANPQTAPERLQELAQLPLLAPIVALNPAATAPLLRTLAGSDDTTIRAAVAAHPNAPLDLLLNLAGEFPAAFCTNPVLPLLLLEQPDLPARIESETLRRLLCYAGVPASILRWIAAHAAPPDAEAARLHIRLAGEAGADWPEHAREALWKVQPPSYSDLLLELLGLGAVPAWLLEMLAAVGDIEVRSAVARSPHTPRALLRSLRHAGASGNLRNYAPPIDLCDPETLARLAKGGVYAQRIAARNPRTPALVLAQLAASMDRSVRQGVASNSAAPPALLARLASDRATDVRQLVARYATTPQILERLARDRSRDVRFTIARNPHTAVATLERLSSDSERIVRQAVARNPITPAATLVRLAEDAHPKVRAMIARRFGQTPPREQEPETTATPLKHSLPHAPAVAQTEEQRAAASATSPDELRVLAEDANPKVRAAVARNPHTPPDLLAWLADDESPLVHRGVAEHPDAPTALLERFAADPTWVNFKVRLAVAQHPQVTPLALERMAGDLSVAVRRLVLAHPRTPPAARQHILARSLDMCLTSSEPFYHAIALAHAEAPVEALLQAEQSSEWLVRFAAAQNPHAPQELLVALSEDGNRLVRAAAQFALLQHSPSTADADPNMAPDGLIHYGVGRDQRSPDQWLAAFDSDPRLRAARAATLPAADEQERS